MRQDLHINNYDIEALCIETINNKGKKFFNLTKKKFWYTLYGWRFP